MVFTYDKTKVALGGGSTGKELGSLIGLPAAHLYLGFSWLAQGSVYPGRRLGRERGIEVETSSYILAVLALQQASTYHQRPLRMVQLQVSLAPQ